jgi:hypothetical protein
MPKSLHEPFTLSSMIELNQISPYRVTMTGGRTISKVTLRTYKKCHLRTSCSTFSPCISVISSHIGYRPAAKDIRQPVIHSNTQSNTQQICNTTPQSGSDANSRLAKPNLSLTLTFSKCCHPFRTGLGGLQRISSNPITLPRHLYP